jgi:GDP-L-fucose synthase
MVSQSAVKTKVYIAGHRGMVGSALLRGLLAKGYTDIVTKTRDELDLTDAVAVDHFF